MRRDLSQDPSQVTGDRCESPAQTSGTTGTLTVPFGAGDRIHRFVVLGPLGAGAMGMVLAAHDPELDRRIAIKLVHPERAGDERAKERLLYEARSGAQLSHPNVVQVYEVGTVGDDVFIAFEYVDGTTLRDWLAAEPRSLEAVLHVFREAGRGLLAAHERGVVHRDFKPDNVLIGHDGRVRVADFGLAGVEAASPVHAIVESGKVTRTGALVGTPAYMAPEQWMASWKGSAGASESADPHAATADGSDGSADESEPAPPDSRADQFSFCVALYEALFGRRPFAGQTVFALQNAVLHDAPRVPSHAQVPAAIRKAILRGLAKDPNARFPGMAQLLAALETKKRSRVALLTIASLCLALVAGVAAFMLASRPPCADAGAAFDSVWNESVRKELRTHLLATGGAHPSEVASRTLRALSAYADAWKDARTATCRATHDQRVQSEPLLDVRMECFDDRARDFAALVSATRQQRSTVDAAVAVTRLAPPAPCRMVRFDGDLDSLPAGEQRRISALRATLSEARAQLALAQYPRAVELAEKARVEAEKHAFSVLQVDAALEESNALRRLAQHDKLEALVQSSRMVAARLGDPARLASLADRLIDLHLQRGANDKAQLLLEEYRLQTAMAGDLPHLIYGYHYMAGRLYQQSGDFERSLSAYLKAREIGREQFAHDDGRLAIVAEGCGIAALNLGRLDEARTLLEEAVASGSEAYGEHHPIVSLTRLNLGIVYKKQGQFALAERAYLASLSVFESAHPGAHHDTAALLNNLGSLLLEQHEYERAMPYLEKAAAMRTELFGADSPTLIYTYANMGLARLGQRRFSEAEPFLRRSIELTRAKLGDDHPKRAAAEVGLGELAVLQGRFADAVGHYEEAGRVTLKAAGAEHQDMVGVHAGVAYAFASLGRCSDAMPRARRVLEMELASTDRELPARAHFSLALCLSDERKGASVPKEASEHAHKAQQTLSGALDMVLKSPTGALLKRQIDGWLERHASQR